MNDMNTTDASHGRISGLYGDVLQGWALDPAKPDMRLVVEIYIDGNSVAFAKASEFHPGAPAGDDFNGFAVQLRESWLVGAKVISARVANQHEWLDGTIQLPSTSPSEPAAAASQLWHTGGLKVSGWAYDATDPHRSVTVTVRKGTEILAKVTADRVHHALTYKASRKHGFELDLPWVLADGQVHTLDIINDLGQPLSGSPLTLCCWPEGLEALLRSNVATIGNEAKVELLAKVARHQELLLPKSADFNHYPEWFEVFQKPEPFCFVQESNCGILIISEGNAQMDILSERSAGHQRCSPLAIEIASSYDVTSGLRRLVSQGCGSIIPIMGGDRLASHAIDHLVSILEKDVSWAYGDCDSDTTLGTRTAPWLKPVWDIDLFIGTDLFSPGAIFKASVMEKALDIARKGSDGQIVDWHDLLAAIALITEQSKLTVAHLPKVLYHRHHIRPTTPATALRCEQREIAIAWLVNCLTRGAVVDSVIGFPGLLKAKWPLPQQLPKVTIIIPTRDQVKLLRACVEGVLKHTDYPHMEILIVDNDSAESETHAYFAELRVRGVKILPYPHPFNYPAVNNRAAEIATGDCVCLLNNDIEILGQDWMKVLVSQLLRPGIGAVGAKLLWPNGMVQHGGVVVGINGVAAHAGNHSSRDDSGYMGLNQVAHRRMSVTGACMLMRKETYLSLGGMDEHALPVAFNDVDLCLRIRHSGLDIIWSADAELVHAESASRGKDISVDRIARANREQQFFRTNWTESSQIDPCYHPALSHDYQAGPYGGLALPPKKLSQVRTQKTQPSKRPALEPLESKQERFSGSRA